MEVEVIDIKSGKLFPFHFQLLGLVFLFIGMVLIVFSPYFSPIPLLLGGLILTGYNGTQFDRSANTYRAYNSFLFFKFGKWQQYNHVESIFINSSKTSQKVYTTVTTGPTVRNVEYNAYIKLGDGTKLHLMTKKDKGDLVKKLTGIKDYFQCEISDNT